MPPSAQREAVVAEAFREARHQGERLERRSGQAGARRSRAVEGDRQAAS
jgi:hypothetical protein